MKTRLVFLVMLIACFSCDTNNKPVSDAQKEKIKGEVKEVVNTIFKGCEEANFDMAIEPWLDSPDLVFIYNGVTLGYKETVDAMKPLFSTLINQKVTIIDERYAFLDKSRVIYTTNCTFLENYKDGHSTLSDPMAMQFTFKKINNEWKVIYGVESSVRQNVKNSGNLEGLTQVELSKYFLGTWQCEIAKETFQVCAYKLLGTGMEANIKIVTKGKTVQEGKLLYGYDKKSDKFIQIFVMSGSDMDVRAFWFTSKNTGEGVLLKDIYNPENANLKMKFEIKSPDLWVATAIENNKTIGTSTYTRVKN
jgi:hypothetical protein